MLRRMSYEQVTVAIKDIQEGSHVRSFELKDPKDASRTMATLKVHPPIKPHLLPICPGLRYGVIGLNLCAVTNVALQEGYSPPSFLLGTGTPLCMCKSQISVFTATSRKAL